MNSCLQYRRFLGLLHLLCLAFSTHSSAQENPVRLSGNIQVGTELYSSSGIPSRKQRSSSRAILRPTLTLFDQISLPFEIYVSSESRGFRQPFNQFGVSPQFLGWLTLHGGYFTSQVSELTFGDTRMLGGGIELHPGKFRFMALYGRIWDAVDPDTAHGYPGAYARNAFAGKIGYGSEDGFLIDFNVMHAMDDTTSISSTLNGVHPAENLVASIDLGVPLFNGLVRFSSEAGVSAYSSDIRSRELEGGSGSLKFLFTPRASTQVDGAVTAGLQFRFSPAFSLGLQTRWVGPGFVSLGYAQLQNDVLDLLLSPTFLALERTLRIRASLGVRYNNLRQNRLATTQRTIVNLGSSYQPTEAVGIDMQYSNYGMRMIPRNDTLRIDNVTQSLNIAPRMVFTWLGGSNFASVSYSFQDFTDRNIITSGYSDNSSQALALTWSLTLPSSLNFTTNYTGTEAITTLVDIRIHSITETVGYALFDNALALGLTGGYNIIRGMSSDGQVTGSFSATYTIENAGALTLLVLSNRYDYENSLAGAGFAETQGSLLYSYSF